MTNYKYDASGDGELEYGKGYWQCRGMYKEGCGVEGGVECFGVLLERWRLESCLTVIDKVLHLHQQPSCFSLINELL